MSPFEGHGAGVRAVRLRRRLGRRIARPRIAGDALLLLIAARERLIGRSRVLAGGALFLDCGVRRIVVRPLRLRDVLVRGRRVLVRVAGALVSVRCVQMSVCRVLVGAHDGIGIHGLSIPAAGLV